MLNEWKTIFKKKWGKTSNTLFFHKEYNTFCENVEVEILPDFKKRNKPEAEIFEKNIILCVENLQIYWTIICFELNVIKFFFSLIKRKTALC